MGFHVCHACTGNQNPRDWYPNTSSGDVTLVFDNGDRWVMPDMILHYVADHGWVPPDRFVADVMAGALESGSRMQTRGISGAPTKVGYLTEPIARGIVPDGFISRLNLLMRQATGRGFRVQTKSAMR